MTIRIKNRAWQLTRSGYPDAALWNTGWQVWKITEIFGVVLLGFRYIQRAAPEVVMESE